MSEDGHTSKKKEKAMKILRNWNNSKLPRLPDCFSAGVRNVKLDDNGKTAVGLALQQMEKWLTKNEQEELLQQIFHSTAINARVHDNVAVIRCYQDPGPGNGNGLVSNGAEASLADMIKSSRDKWWEVVRQLRTDAPSSTGTEGGSTIIDALLKTW